MPRVAFYAPMKPLSHPVPSGDRRIGRLLFRALGQAGFEVEEVSGLRVYDGAGDADLQNRLGQAARREARTMLAHWRDLPAHQRPSAFFTYHNYHKAPDWIGPMAAELTGIPYFIAEASHAPKQAQGPWAQGFRAAEQAIRRATRILVLNPADRPALETLLGSDERLVNLSPFVDCIEIMRRLPDRQEARAALSQLAPGANPEQEIFLATVAMMRPGDKAASYRLLAAALRMLPDLPWRLFVIGDGPARTEVLQAFEGLSDRAHFLGRRDGPDVYRVLRGCDLYAWPAVNEAFGMAILEAQASGLPVVVGRYGGVEGVAHDGETGRLTRPGDAENFASALRDLILDPAQRNRLASSTRSAMLDRHDIAAAARLLRSVMIPHMRAESLPPVEAAR